MDGDESVDFSAKYRDWVVIKKMSIREDTKPEEIAFALASIRQTIDRKAFDFLNIDTKALDDYAAKVAGGKRKSWSTLAEILQPLGTQEVKAIVDKASNGRQEVVEAANAYLFRRVAQTLGFDFDVNMEMLSKAFPNLKMPKPRGRMPKK